MKLKLIPDGGIDFASFAWIMTLSVTNTVKIRVNALDGNTLTLTLQLGCWVLRGMNYRVRHWKLRDERKRKEEVEERSWWSVKVEEFGKNNVRPLSKSYLRRLVWGISVIYKWRFWQSCVCDIDLALVIVKKKSSGKKNWKIENCTISIPKGKLYCRAKNSAREPPFKVSSEELSTAIDILLRSPIQVQTEADCCLTPSVPGGWLLQYANND